jgi:hypothetical protein
MRSTYDLSTRLGRVGGSLETWTKFGRIAARKRSFRSAKDRNGKQLQDHRLVMEVVSRGQSTRMVAEARLWGWSFNSILNALLNELELRLENTLI